MNIRLISATALSLIILALSGCSPVQSSQPAKSPITGGEIEKVEVAAEGYDPVSYFAVDKGLKGNPQIALIYNGAKWLFKNEENRKRFAASAEKYIPDFESYCPYSLSEGKMIRGKPSYWRIANDRLYFFYSERYAKEFDKDPEMTVEKARKTYEKSK